MGPRPFSRGHPWIDGYHEGRHYASMGPRPFSRGHWMGVFESNKDTPGFNGAATFQSRTPAARIALAPTCWRLQWGRDLSVADTRVHVETIGVDRLGFNGAATFQSRTLVRRLHKRDEVVASMGPRPFSRGHSLRAAITVKAPSVTERLTRTLTSAEQLLVV